MIPAQLRIDTPAFKFLPRYAAMLALSAFGLVALGSCTTARMQLPPGLAQAQLESWPVQGRQANPFSSRLGFGPYRFSEVRRGWISGQSLSIFVYQTSRRQHKFRFTLNAPGSPPILAHGITRARWNQLNFQGRQTSILWGLSGESVTSVEFHFGGRPWGVLLSANDREQYFLGGVLTDGRRTIEIAPTRQLRDAAWEIASEAGFLFSEDGRYLGAVETINAGEVFLRRDLDPETKTLLAVACGALLLHRNLVPGL